MVGNGSIIPCVPFVDCKLRDQFPPQHPHSLSKRYSHCQHSHNPLKFPQATALTYFSNNCYLVNTFHIPVALNPTGQMQSWTASCPTVVQGLLWGSTCGKLLFGKDLILPLLTLPNLGSLNLQMIIIFLSPDGRQMSHGLLYLSSIPVTLGSLPEKRAWDF